MGLLNSAWITLRDRGAGVLVRAGVNLAHANFHRRVLGRRWVVRPIHSYRMNLDLEDPGISRSLILFGTREVDHKIMLERVLEPGMTVFDIGANIGYYVLMEHGLLGEEGYIVAIEPSPANVALLRENLDLNRCARVKVVEGAVSDRSGTRALHLSKLSNLNTFHPDGSARAYLSDETVEVTTYTVSGLTETHGTPDLIRMDVEGHEVNVIGGMLAAIDAGRKKPMICFEPHLTRYSKDNDMEAALEALFSRGYAVRLLSSSHERGTRLIAARGYEVSAPIATDGMTRVIFENIGPHDAIDIICRSGGGRTVLLTAGK